MTEASQRRAQGSTLAHSKHTTTGSVARGTIRLNRPTCGCRSRSLSDPALSCRVQRCQFRKCVGDCSSRHLQARCGEATHCSSEQRLGRQASPSARSSARRGGSVIIWRAAQSILGSYLPDASSGRPTASTVASRTFLPRQHNRVGFFLVREGRAVRVTTTETHLGSEAAPEAAHGERFVLHLH